MHTKGPRNKEQVRVFGESREGITTSWRKGFSFNPKVFRGDLAVLLLHVIE